MTKTIGWVRVATAGTALLLGIGVSIAQTPDAAVPQVPAASAPTATTGGGTIHGTVKAGAVPLPGVAITATNTLTGKKYATTTDVDGNYAMTIPRTGRYVVRAELAAFASMTHEVRITAEATEQNAEFAMELASRVEAQAAAAGQQTASAAATTRGVGTQALGVLGGEPGLEDATAGAANSGVSLPSLSGVGDAGAAGGDASDSVAVSGQQGTTNPLANMSEDQLRDRVNNVLDQVRAQGGLTADQQTAVVGMLGGILGGGGFGGPGGGGPGGGRGGGGGAFRNFNPAQPHGALFYQGGNTALNSAPWSPTLKPLTNPAGYSNRFGVSIAGSPYIPGLTKPDTRQFVFINLTGQKNLNAFLPNPVRVPTLLERAGNFSQSFQEANGVAVPITLIDPKTGLPISGNNLANATIPISLQALALLNYYPACNINCASTDPTVYNFQTISNAGANNVAINARYQRQLGKATGGPFGGRGGGGGGQRGQRQAANQKPTLRQSINAAYNFAHSANDNRNIFLPLGGTTFSDGYSLNLGYSVSYGRLSNNASVNWNRSHGETRNYFTDTANNPTAAAGITVPNQASSFADPRFYNGLPSIGITNFAGLTNQTPSNTINQTISFSDVVSWRYKAHNYRFGVDLRRVHADSIGGQNPLGRLTFTGFETSSAFADFLLGLPQTTSIQAGKNKIYLRENVFDLYANDDFRVMRNVTLNYGLRYEYFAPYTEKNNHLVNLAPNANFTQVERVLPGATSQYNGTYPPSLVNPDRTMFAPRFGVAYSPKFKWTKNMVIRGGYGINYNTGQFGNFAKSLSFQAPFAETQTNVAPTATTAGTSGCTATTKTTAANITLASGFGCSTGNAIQNNYAVDKNYRLGMVQVYNLNIQKTLGPLFVVNLGYNGSKGSNLDIEGSPNSTPAGTTIPGVSAFNYETSVAGSHSNQLVVSVQQRQKKGIALGATYTYSHAIDNASSIGGGGGSTVQNFYRLDLEESNSNFDQRHLLSGTWLLELPFGPNREYLNKGGFWAKALDGFSLSGAFTFGTGNYFTPQYTGTIAQAAGGGNYTQRPNRDFTQSTTGSGKLKSYFNTAAFTAPTVIGGVTQYGTASRNSIEGPGTVSTNATLAKTVPMSGTMNFEARVTATNVFNTVQYSGINTTLNSQTYGQVTSAAGMRALQMQARFRF